MKPVSKAERFRFGEDAMARETRVMYGACGSMTKKVDTNNVQ